jgi:hypothetical protein
MADDRTTERILHLQSQLRIRLAELGFAGLPAATVVHHLAEVAALAGDLSDGTVPLFLELSPAHCDALLRVVTHLKWDLDELKDAIQDLEPGLLELLDFLRPREPQ